MVLPFMTEVGHTQKALQDRGSYLANLTSFLLCITAEAFGRAGRPARRERARTPVLLPASAEAPDLMSVPHRTSPSLTRLRGCQVYGLQVGQQDTRDRATRRPAGGYVPSGSRSRATAAVTQVFDVGRGTAAARALAHRGGPAATTASTSSAGLPTAERFEPPRRPCLVRGPRSGEKDRAGQPALTRREERCQCRSDPPVEDLVRTAVTCSGSGGPGRSSPPESKSGKRPW